MTISASSWMTQNFESLAPRPFKSLAIPGSHDSGMSSIGGSIWRRLIAPYTVTQSLGICDQIAEGGARYLDLRPSYYGPEGSSDAGVPAAGYYTAHWSRLGSGWIGGVGQSWASVCADLTDALARLASHEVVFIELSHAAVLLEGQGISGSVGSLQCAQKNDIIGQLLTAVKDYIYTGDASTQIGDLTLASIDAGRPSVIVWMSDDSLSGSQYGESDGLFSANALPYTNMWDQAQSSDPGQLIADLQSELQAKDVSSPPFFMSWHCTFAVGDVRSLKTLAEELNPRLPPTLAGWLEDGVFDPSKGNIPCFVAWDFVAADGLASVQACIDLRYGG